MNCASSDHLMTKIWCLVSPGVVINESLYVLARGCHYPAWCGNIRREVWNYLGGVYPNSNLKERKKFDFIPPKERWLGRGISFLDFVKMTTERWKYGGTSRGFFLTRRRKNARSLNCFWVNYISVRSIKWFISLELRSQCLTQWR